jgi:monoterpene epsilon-lactone hydrolase
LQNNLSTLFFIICQCFESTTAITLKIKRMMEMQYHPLKENSDINQHLLLNEAGPSWQTRFIVLIFRLLGIKKRLSSAANVQKHVKKLVLKPASHEPVGLGRGVRVSLMSECGWPVYYTNPEGETTPDNYVVFLHGGGYINEIVKAHWRFVGFLTREANVCCVVPIYPVAPGGTAEQVVPTIGRLLQRLLKKKTIQNITVIGNSAGAGMALAAAQWLKNEGISQPKNLILISPGLSAALDQPAHQAVAVDDPLLDIPGIREGVRLYAGNLDLNHPYVSPLNGDFRGLAPMLVFSGTLDLLYPDSVEMVAKAATAGVTVEFQLRKGQPHNYPVLPTPEGKEARQAILRAVRN